MEGPHTAAVVSERLSHVRWSTDEGDRQNRDARTRDLHPLQTGSWPPLQLAPEAGVCF